MNKNINKMLDILLQQKNFITNKQLATLIGVTERSVRNYVAKVNSSSKGDCLIISSENGYKLNKVRYGIETDETSNMNGDGRLLFQIAFLLAKQGDYVQLDTIADQLNYSRESIRSKIQKLFVRIKHMKLDVTFDSKVFTGVRLIGKEEAIRLLLEQLVPLKIFSKDRLVERLSLFFEEMLDKSTIKNVIKLLDEALANSTCTVEYKTYVKMIVHLVIMIIRTNNNEYIEHLVAYDRDILEFSEYKMAEELLKYMKLENNNELLSLTYYLLSLPLDIDNSEVFMNDKNNVFIVENSLLKTEKYFGIPVFSNKKFRNQIVNHIARLLNPIRENIPIFNPYASELKHEYIFAYSIASFIYDDLEKQMDLSVPEEEIAYLSIHIQLVLNEEKKRELNVLLLVQNKQIETLLIKNKVEMFFQNIKITRIDHKLRQEIPDCYNLILTTVDEYSDNYKGIKIIHISRNFNSKDIQNVQRFVETSGISDLIENADYFHINEKSNIAALKRLLDLSGYSDLFDEFKERESMSTTEVGNLTALPHPFLTKFPYHSKVIIGINQSNIMWGEQNVRLIIAYIPAKQLGINNNFFRDVYIHSSNLNIVQEILKTQKKNDFIRIWNKERGY